jgi:hypothetical protein
MDVYGTAQWKIATEYFFPKVVIWNSKVDWITFFHISQQYLESTDSSGILILIRTIIQEAN